VGIKFRGQQNNGSEENIFWVTMADLLLGLAIIFITLFVLAMTGFSQQDIQQQKVQMEVSEKLGEELQKSNVDVDVDKMTGDLKIADVELFELNSYVLSPRGKALLDKLAPIYINTIFSDKNLSDKIQYIIIQGHTDSQTFAGINSKDEQFLRNMDLSLKRANAVAEYIFKTNYNKDYSDKFRKIVVVEGKSFNKSRRVELKLQVKDWNITKALGLKK
jgi:outer membrane protein OmpA-like peptidoglycan-associated protein